MRCRESSRWLALEAALSMIVTSQGPWKPRGRLGVSKGVQLGQADGWIEELVGGNLVGCETFHVAFKTLL